MTIIQSKTKTKLSLTLALSALLMSSTVVEAATLSIENKSGQRMHTQIQNQANGNEFDVISKDTKKKISLTVDNKSTVKIDLLENYSDAPTSPYYIVISDKDQFKVTARGEGAFGKSVTGRINPAYCNKLEADADTYIVLSQSKIGLGGKSLGFSCTNVTKKEAKIQAKQAKIDEKAAKDEAKAQKKAADKAAKEAAKAK